jgi:Zn finger protein HypA/HybF involved in hydrogenase expression
MVIGELSTIIDDSVRLYFGLIAAEADLCFRRVKAQFYCRHCRGNRRMDLNVRSAAERCK